MEQSQFKEIRDAMSEAYDYYHEKKDKAPGYHIMLGTFDTLLEQGSKFQTFVNEFVKLRKDFLSSDRECVAFIIALDELGYS